MTHQKSKFIDRRARTLLTPEYEDSGLFKSDILQLNVELTPIISRNSRQDLIVHCYNGTSHSFEVTFAGRRSLMAMPLVTDLEVLRETVAKAGADATGTPKDLVNVRVPVQIEGAWRRRFWTDDDGWLTRIHQFVAARWFVMGAAERVVAYGVAPTVRPMAPPH